MVLRSTVTYNFKERFHPSEGCHIIDWATRFSSVDSSQALGLEAPFIEVEILQSLKEADCNKAPGPDDFLFKFGQTFGDVLRGDFLGVFQGFYENVEFDYKFSKLFISIIPKVKASTSLNDFRHICLLG